MIRIVILAAFGFFLGCSFQWLRPLDSLIAVPMMYAAFLFLFFQPGLGRPSWMMLPRFCLILYFLPMAPLIESMGGRHPDYAAGFELVDAALAHPDTVTVLANIVLVGLLGMGAGILSGLAVGPSLPGMRMVKPRTLTTAACICWLVPLLILMYLITPRDTILTMSYGELLDNSSSRISVRGFDGFGYLLYVILVCIYLDIETGERYGVAQGSKKRVFWATVVIVVVVFNLLRGGRSSAGMLAAFAALRASTPQGRALLARGIGKIKWFRIIAIGAPLFLIYFSWDNVRNSTNAGADAVREGIIQRLSAFYRSGTWMGGTFASVGMAEEYESGQMVLMHGETYLDYALSLPPSMVARVLNYTRPLETTQGPAWWYMGYTAGGMHPIVVPFKNFGILGVLCHMYIVGLIIGVMESIATRESMAGRLIYGAMFVTSMHWFWYGDMYFVRAMMAAAITYILYLAMSRNMPMQGARVPPMRS